MSYATIGLRSMGSGSWRLVKGFEYEQLPENLSRKGFVPIVDTHGLTPVALAKEVCIYLDRIGIFIFCD
jgi:hypothetical protein